MRLLIYLCIWLLVMLLLFSCDKCEEEVPEPELCGIFENYAVGADGQCKAIVLIGEDRDTYIMDATCEEGWLEGQGTIVCGDLTPFRLSTDPTEDE